MKRFIKFYNTDKENFKMNKQTEKGFELIILSDKKLKEFIELIHMYEEQGDEVYIMWQMKFKPGNYALYKNCKFSDPMDNMFAEPEYIFLGKKKSEPKLIGKKFKVSCSGVNYYSSSIKNNIYSRDPMSNKYKDYQLLDRMLKIGELNSL